MNNLFCKHILPVHNTRYVNKVLGNSRRGASWKMGYNVAMQHL
ncbi:MAG: hypothetical protein ABJA71_13965 [Ginsengibacter sp.]